MAQSWRRLAGSVHRNTADAPWTRAGASFNVAAKETRLWNTTGRTRWTLRGRSNSCSVVSALPWGGLEIARTDQASLQDTLINTSK